MKKLLVALMTLCLILSMGFAVAEETHYTIAYAPQSMANDFFIAVGTPIQAAVEARGDTYVTIVHREIRRA